MPQSVDARFSEALRNTARGWRLGLDRRLKFLGLGQAGWMTIANIARAGKPMSQIELANAVGVEGATMVTMLDRLVRGGLVQRQPSTTDRRIKLISLTEEGKVVYEKLSTVAKEYGHELLSGMDKAAVKQATLLLEQIHEAIEASR